MRTAAHLLLRPQSIAIVGLAPPTDEAKATHHEIMGMRVLANLERFGRAADIHLVSRAPTINGRATLPNIEALPEGVELALLAIPPDSAPAALKQCGARGVKAAILYADADNRDELAAAAREAGVALLGPTTVGLSNFVDGLSLSFGNHKPIPVTEKRTLAILSQSGGVSGQTRLAMEALGLPISYSICTGDEADLTVADFLDFLIEDSVTHVIAVFAEAIRSRTKFLNGVRNARAAGKHIILLHPRHAATDHAFDAAIAANAGAIVVDGLEELWDIAEILLRFPEAPNAGAALLCDGGAKSILADIATREGLPIATLRDLSGQGLTDWDVYGRTARDLLADKNVGSLVVSVMPGPPDIGLRNARATLPALENAQKPVVYTMMGGTSPVAPELEPEMRAAGVPLRRSPERVLRAMAKLTRFGMQAPADRADIALSISETPSSWKGARRVGGGGAHEDATPLYLAFEANDGALLNWRGERIGAKTDELGRPAALICNFLDVDPAHEEELNEWYDAEHIPRLVALDGVITALRYRSIENTPRYLTVFALARADIAKGPAWLAASRTPWQARIKRFTRGMLSFLFAPAKEGL